MAEEPTVLERFFQKELFASDETPLGVTESTVQEFINKNSLKASSKGLAMLAMATHQLYVGLGKLIIKHDLDVPISLGELSTVFQMISLYAKITSGQPITSLEARFAGMITRHLERISEALVEKDMAITQQMASVSDDPEWKALKKEIPALAQAYHTAGQEYARLSATELGRRMR